MSIERLLDASRAFDRGDLDAAERVYLAVANADPRNPIALMGLARVAMARATPDDLSQAQRLASTVLARDPGNVAATRLLDAWRIRMATVTPAQGDVDDAGQQAATDVSGESDAAAMPEPEPEAGPEVEPGETPVEAEAEATAADTAADAAADGPTGDTTNDSGDEAFPWPDLDDQPGPDRVPGSGWLDRLLRRRRR